MFVVQWRDVNSPFYSSRIINFQVRLYETTNIIEFWFGSVSGSGDYEYAAFGIEDHIGGSGHFIDGPTGSNTVGTAGLNSYDNWPTVFYRFAPAPVKVLRPNGGEFFSIGYTDTIKWVSTVNNVKLEYSTNSGSNWNMIATSVPASTRKYAWLVPNTPSENSLVRISDAANPSVFDISDNVFTISQPPVITVLPDSFYFLLNEGDSTESVMQISNSGLGNLFYEISIENLSYQFKKLSGTPPTYSATMWKESFYNAQSHRDKNFRSNTNRKGLAKLVLPLIVSDPAGDGDPVDIIQIRGRSTADSIQMEFVFRSDLNPYDFGGYLGLDTDQNYFTGEPLPFGLPAQEVGCEYFIGLFSLQYNSVDVYDQYFNYLGSFEADYDLRSFRFEIPLMTLGNDDGVMNLAAVVGNAFGPTDWIPDQGYGVLGGTLWLTVEPTSGTILPGGNKDVAVKINTDRIDGGEYYANMHISSNDPVNHIVTVPVHLTVVAQPNLVAPDSVNFGQVYIGYPELVPIELRNNGSLTLEVSDVQSSNALFSVLGNTSFSIEPNGMHLLPVLFSPVTPGPESGTLTIISNDPSSPEEINLKGEGLFPPVISVSPDSFFYDLNVGDSVTTQMVIENSGLGDLVFQISDRLIAGRVIKESKNNYTMNRSNLKKHNDLFGLVPENFSKFISVTKPQANSTTYPVIKHPTLALPIIVQDVIGDGGVADIKAIRGRIYNNNLEIEYVFADGINMSDSLIAILFLDIDRDSLTGAYDPYYYHDLGVDYFVYYLPLYFGNEIIIFEFSTGYSYTVPFVINGTTIAYSVPLSFLGNDDGEMDLLALSGYESIGELDWAPDEGHATLFADAFWLSEDPTSGIIPPGGNMTIEIRANTSELIGGNYLASIDIQNNDPANSLVAIPFAMHLTGIPQIVVSPNSLNFGETYIGYYKSLFLSIYSTGTDSLFGNIISSDARFVVIDSTFALPVGGVKNVEVQFHPASLGTVNAQLSINSNASPVPIIVLLTGKGVIAPNIVTNTSLFEFEAGIGDTLQSNFIIYNTGGSDLVVEISDVQTDTKTERLFAAGFNMIYEINPDDGQIMNSFPTPVFTSDGLTGLAFSGEHLYFTDSFTDYFIYVMKPENGNVITSYPAPSTTSDGLAYVDPYLYVNDYSYGWIYVLNPLDGTIVNTLYPPVYTWGGLDGSSGRLFASDDIYIYELNPRDGSLINSFTTIQKVYGIGCTEERLFTSFPWGGIDEYDPNTGNYIRTISSIGYAALAGSGIRDAKWLSENPAQATILAGDSISISLIITAPNEFGHYTADIILESNDPDSSVVKLQVVLDVVTGVKEENSLPKVYSLYNNYPNPFNPSTTIKYDLPKQSFVSLKIYSIVGEEVATIISEEQNAGRYQVQWNASQIASGVYFYQLRVGDPSSGSGQGFVETKKMMLLK